MKVVEFVNYVKEQTGKDWEELCYHLMSTLVTEDKWNQEMEDLGQKVDISHPLLVVTHCAMEMGWDIAVPKDSEVVNGMILGTPDYIDSVIKTDEEDEAGSTELSEGSPETTD